jgi:hypothetical protein
MHKLLLTTLASSLLLFTGTVAQAQTARARFADTPIRAEANPAGAIVATVMEGGPVEAVELQGDWYRVRVSDELGQSRTGYVLANLIELVDADGSPQSILAPPESLAARPVAQGFPIPPTPIPLPPRRDKAKEREEAAKAEVDALRAELEALQNNQPIRQIRSGSAPQPMGHHAQARQGFWFNAGLGLGSMGCGHCVGRWSGGTGGLSLGGTINDRLLLGVGTTGWVDNSTHSAGTLDARVHFYPVRTSGLFITGGIGLGQISEVGDTESGVGTVVGVGWDIRVRSNLSLTPFWNGFAVRTSNNSVNVGQLGLSITVH